MGQPQRTIGSLSKATGVKVTTIRYYETNGLMQDPERSASGQRLYGPEAVDRLIFIRHARELGFPLDDIRELIDLQTKPSADCALVDAIAQRHLSDVRRRLTQLEALEAELKRMISACEGGKVAGCQILESLADHDHCLSKDHGKLDLIVSSGSAT